MLHVLKNHLQASSPQNIHMYTERKGGEFNREKAPEKGRPQGEFHTSAVVLLPHPSPCLLEVPGTEGLPLK